MDNEFTLDLSPFPRELKLLLLFTAMGNDPDRADRIKDCLTDIDWNLFLQLARHHRVYPLVYSNLKKVDKELIPVHIMQALYLDYSRNTFQMLHLTAEMEKICRLFDDNHIRTLLLKGPVLTQALYGDLSLRTCKDLDILLPFEDVEKAEQLLIKQGFAPDHEEIRILNDWKWRVHHLSYYNPETKVQVEIHWRLNPDKGSEPDFDEMWSRRSVSTVTNYPIHVLGDEDMFLFLVTHGARHAWFRLRWLADIDRLVRKPLNWEGIFTLLKKYHCQAVGGQALVLVSELLLTPLSEDLKPLYFKKQMYRLAQSAIIFIQDMITLSPVPKHLKIYYRRYLFSLRSLPQKWAFVFSQLYPNNRDLETLPLPKQLYLLYFPLRPFLWCWRRMKQQQHASS
ncbi:nucleotidyltransferase family protein [Paenibacillus solisilvae]|uniref:Nucleotidyltransferase family protein n=1 Tax=Paenibacillus solisilvae TaxID=2486751 RepID=A0ABW0W7A9_9BACL